MLVIRPTRVRLDETSTGRQSECGRSFVEESGIVERLSVPGGENANEWDFCTVDILEEEVEEWSSGSSLSDGSGSERDCILWCSGGAWWKFF
jgi:hypothetical protein